ncbi:MAG TPA: hypothetical protein PK263_03200 [bacterium]|nr:hypothetical protein [bacterium]
MKKYVCMKELCEFCSNDLEDAFEHVKSLKHPVAEVEMEDGVVSCSLVDRHEGDEYDFEE